MKNITELISEETINVTLNVTTKKEVLESLINTLYNAGRITSKEEFLNDVLKREEVASTYMGHNIAIPHAKSKSVLTPTIAFALNNEAVSYDNENKANVFFMIAVPEGSSQEHLQIIAALARNLAKEDFRNSLSLVKTKQDFLDLLNKVFNSNNASTEQNKNNYDLVAVTACSVGIAHTYLAAENLVKTANKMGLKIKVQTNGSIGIQNQLTEEDINGAKAVIIASDISIDENVFKGKPKIKVKVKEAVHRPEILIKKALELKKDTSSSNEEKEILNQETQVSSFGIYKDLMSGVSHMIPFIVMGGVFIALSIALSGITPGQGAVITNPFLKKMSDVGGMAFSLVPAILAGYISFSITGRPGLAPGIIGGFIAQTVGAGFLGGLVAGFIAGYIVKLLLKIPFNKTIQAIVPVLFIPVIGGGIVAIIMEIIGLPIATFMAWLTHILNVMQANNSSLVLYFLLGLMVAIDMGGPINKVAFLFGATMIQQGVPQIMGVVSVAVCIPPLSMGIVSLIDKKYYTKEEQGAGKAAILLGLVGITEGAIPFAAANPFKVIPSIMVGSAVGSLVGGIFKVADYAPHGGPIVLPVVEYRLYWLLSVIIGVIASIICNMLLNRLSLKKLNV